MKLLRIDSSARTASVTRQLTARAAEEWKENNPDGDVIHRDLSAIQMPAITDDWSATLLEASKLSPGQQSYLSTSDQLIDELRAADTIETFGSGPNGPRGLLEMKKVIVITARGGAYEKGTAREAFDFQEPYLRHILGFIGLTDVAFIHAENQSRDQAAASLESAAERITGLLADQNRQAVTF